MIFEENHTIICNLWMRSHLVLKTAAKELDMKVRRQVRMCHRVISAGHLSIVAWLGKLFNIQRKVSLKGAMGFCLDVAQSMHTGSQNWNRAPSRHINVRGYTFCKQSANRDCFTPKNTTLISSWATILSSVDCSYLLLIGINLPILWLCTNVIWILLSCQWWKVSSAKS